MSRLGPKPLAALPIVLLLAVAASPVILLIAHIRVADGGLDTSSLGRTLAFALGGALVATLVGGCVGLLTGTLSLPGGRWLLAAACVLIAAPPAFWWLGAIRLPGLPWSWFAGPMGAAVVTGFALSPIPLLLVHAALREVPSNLYEAARVSLPPLRQLTGVLLPLLQSPLAGGFLLCTILLLGESEIPFLFGFRTAMTDIVTSFSQTFDVSRVILRVLPLLLVVLGLGVLAGGPLLKTVLASSRGSHGVIRRRGPAALTFVAALPAALVLCALTGYALAVVPGPGREWSAPSVQAMTFVSSVGEPVACSWISGFLAVAAVYPLRSSGLMKWCLWAGLLLFCIPGAIFGIGWIGMGQALQGLVIPPGVAHCSRAVGLPLLAFAIAYSRLPRSLDDAARLVAIPPWRRALTLILPLLAPSLVAASAVVAAVVFADRDVASVLLSPGASRLMLNLYLVSANAPSATVGTAALLTLAGAAVSVALAAAGPLLLARRRG